MKISFNLGQAGKVIRRAGLTVVLAASGCSLAGEPYYLGRWEIHEAQDLEVSGYARPNDPATGLPLLHVCYNKMIHSTETLRRFTLNNCANPRLVYNESDLFSCAIMAPIRATFLCDRLSREAAEARPNLKKSEFYTGQIQFGVGDESGQRSGGNSF